MRVEIIEVDALSIDVDILCLKFAQFRYGLDRHIFSLLLQSGVEASRMSPKPGEYALVPATEPIRAREVLFVGTNPLSEWNYLEVRTLARRFLVSLGRSRPDVSSIALTVHGANFGLDAAESFESMIAGLADAVREGQLPKHLMHVTFVESSTLRADQLRRVLDELLPDGMLTHIGSIKSNDASQERLRAAGYASANKSHVFVAMPFADEFQDVYDYAIQGAVKRCGFLCERVDLTAFTGDVMERVQERIRTSSLLIAELSGANPNVYLEVGYAWGCKVPCVLLVHDTQELKFDVRGHRCIIYKRIKELEEKLALELEALLETSASGCNY